MRKIWVHNSMMLQPEQMERYARQISLPEIGVLGQQKLLNARVLLVGLGGLGSAAAYYLTAAGVGTLGLMDDDDVELSNLQRQILHTTADINQPKLDSAVRSLSALNPDIHLRQHTGRFTADIPLEQLEYLQDYEIVVDATDTSISKFAVADACRLVGRPYVHAGITDYYGYVFTVLPGKTACYRCVFNDFAQPDHNSPKLGTLGVLPGIIGCLQATEVLKYLLNIGQLLTNRLLTINVLTMELRVVEVKPNPQCSCMSEL